MKKPISLVLVMLVLMNTLGYYGVFFGLQYHNSERLSRAFDDSTYDESKESVIRVPINLPYNRNLPFERVHGTFEYNGEFYRLVKQRVVSDTLEVVLFKDDRHREILEDLVNYTDQNTRGNATKTVDFIKDYLPNTISMFHASDGWQRMLNKKPVVMEVRLSFHRLESPPPKEV